MDLPVLDVSKCVLFGVWSLSQIQPSASDRHHYCAGEAEVVGGKTANLYQISNGNGNYKGWRPRCVMSSEGGAVGSDDG